MSVPVTNGVLRTKLSDMKVGDYIKFGYTGLNGDIGTFTIGGEGLTVEADRGNAGYVYFIKVDTGLLISTKALNTSVSMQSLNQHNYLKGSGIRCGSSAEILKYFNSDLGGTVIPYGVPQNGSGYRRVFQIPWTNSGMVLQDYHSFPYAETSGFTNLNIRFTSSDMGFLPFYEYIDNSKSTNIFY